MATPKYKKEEIEKMFREVVDKNVELLISVVWLKWNVEDLMMLASMLGSYKTIERWDPYWKNVFAPKA